MKVAERAARAFVRIATGIGVLITTVVPNIAELILRACYALSAGFLTLPAAIISQLLGGSLLSLFLFSDIKASRAEADA